MYRFFEKIFTLNAQRSLWLNILRVALPALLFSVIFVIILVTFATKLFPEVYPIPNFHIWVISPLLASIATLLLAVPIVWLNIKTFQKLHDQRQETESAKTKMEKIIEQRARFVAYIGHEIRNPLNGIMGISNALEDSGLSPEQLDKLNVLKNSSVDLLNILNDILDMSKVDSGALILHPQPMDLIKIITDIKEFWMSRVAVNKLELELKFAKNFPKWVKIDASRFRQVANNLVSNAIKYTETGKVEICANYDDINKTYMIYVKDTGRGIPDGLHNAIFDPYFQVPELGEVSPKLGTGLGLPIARQIAVQMGGDVRLVTSSQAGSLFLFSLKLEILENPEDVIATNAIKPIDFTGKTALIVDDLATNRFVAAGMLAKMGFKVSSAENGKSALKLLSETQYDLILLDEYLGDISGIELFHQAKISHRGACFIAYSGTDPERAREKYLAIGFDGFAEKPLIFQSFCDKLWQVCAQK